MYAKRSVYENEYRSHTAGSSRAGRSAGVKGAMDRRIAARRQPHAGHRFIMTFLVLCLIIVCSTSVLAIARSSETAQPERCYTSVTIRQGDTLSDIEALYNDRSVMSQDAYIRELKSMNHMTGNTIHAGKKLMILYYR